MKLIFLARLMMFPQDFNVGADNQQINQQRLAALKKQAKENGEVFPYETIDVYATDKAVKEKTLPEIKEAGKKLTVHVNIAEKLVKKGLVTKEKPADTKKAEKGSEDEVIAKITAAQTAADVDALVTEDASDKVKKAAEKRKKELSK
jgi:hypothetical protein